MRTLLLIAALWIAGGSSLVAEEIRYAIAIHGGAGSSPERFTAEQNAARHASLKRVLEAGVKILKEGGTSLDAVEEVVRLLEDDPLFNAGKGAVLNAKGGCELDASIMDGKTLGCGAVAGVTVVKNPIALARKVMTETRHVLLSGPGANTFAEEQKVPLVENAYFITEDMQKSWERVQNRLQEKKSAESRGTVGCVALDSHGNLAAATSTGGLMNKKFGRVGDSPIVGAGTYAANDTCAVSCTGTGEEFIRRALAYDVAAQMRYANRPVDAAVKEILTQKLKPNVGGIIAVDKNGVITMQFNTGGMPRAAADSTGRFEVIWPGGED